MDYVRIDAGEIMDKYFEVIDINENNLMDIKFNNVLAVKITATSGMGDCGSVYFLCYDDGLKYYYLNYMHSKKELMEKVFNSFNKAILEEIYQGEVFSRLELKGFKQYGIGMCNYLFVKNDFVVDFENVANSYPRGIIDGYVISISNVYKFLFECFKNYHI